jgi:hypothetical protein
MRRRMSRLQRTLALSATLAVVTPAAGRAQVLDAAIAVRGSDARTRDPYEGWKQSCHRASYAGHGFGLGAYFGALVAVIPAGILALAGPRKAILPVVAASVGGFGALGGWFGYAVAACPTSISTAELDAHVDADSLLGLLQQFSREPHPAESRALARAIHCESMRIAHIPRYGPPALRLAHSRFATPDDFARLERLVLAAYPPPSFITNAGCNEPTGRVTGRVIDAASGTAPETRVVLAISGVTYMARPDDAGSFDFALVPASGTDSLTLTVCGARYELETRRVLVRRGSTERVDVALRRGREFDPGPGRGTITAPPDDFRKIGDAAHS